MKRARMKAGHRPIVLGSTMVLVPEHPTYWVVPEAETAGVDLLVEAGQIEYEPAFSRTEGGQFAVPELATAAAAGKPFARKGARG